MIRINHIAAYVNDLETTKKFFIKYFNASSNNMYHNPTTGLKTYFLTFGNETRLEIMTRPDVISSPMEEYRAGYIHLAFSLGSREAVNLLTRRLAEDGFHVLSGPRVTGDGFYESCVLGVENLILELTE